MRPSRIRRAGMGKSQSMSTIPTSQRPTDTFRPATPLARERVAPIVEPIARPSDSLRTWLAIVSVIALAAAAVAIYAVVQADDVRSSGASPSGLASNARVDRISSELKALRAGAGGASSAALAARVDQLSSQVQGLRGAATGAGAASGLGTRVAALESTVKALASRPATGDQTQSIAQLSSRVDTLTNEVAQLKPSQPTP